MKVSWGHGRGDSADWFNGIVNLQFSLSLCDCLKSRCRSFEVFEERRTAKSSRFNFCGVLSAFRTFYGCFPVFPF